MPGLQKHIHFFFFINFSYKYFEQETPKPQKLKLSKFQLPKGATQTPYLPSNNFEWKFPSRSFRSTRGQLCPSHYRHPVQATESTSRSHYRTSIEGSTRECTFKVQHKLKNLGKLKGKITQQKK